jgi:Nif-specific regulatory protein
MLRLSRLFSEPDGLGKALDALLSYARMEMGAQMAMVRVLRYGSEDILAHKASPPEGLGPGQDEALTRALERVCETGQSVIDLNAAELSSSPGPAAGQGGNGGFSLSLCCVPISRAGKTLGCLAACGRFGSAAELYLKAGELTLLASLLAAQVDLFVLENVEKVLWERRAQSLAAELGEMRSRYCPSNLVGSSKAMQEVYFLIRKVAAKKTTVLLIGESGVGKETAANAIHYDGLKAAGPLVKFGCAQAAEQLAESRLFGRERGILAGAAGQKGRFEDADGGTIFLDDIDQLPLGVQAKLLRFLKERSFERAGGAKAVRADVRVVAATCRDLAELVAEGRFIEDLYYRLSVFPIVIPPLREREGDVGALARHFLARFNEETGKDVKAISPQAMKALKSYDWPGNVRELENVMLRAVILAEDGTVQLHDLPLALKSASGQSRPGGGGLAARLDNIEHEMLTEALRLHRGNISAAAKDLGVTRRSMGLRMKRLSLSYKQFRPAQGPAA